MKKILIILLLPGLTLFAEEQKLSVLEQITQPKVSFQSDFLSDAKFQGYEGSVKTYKQKIQINNNIIGFSYSRWDFDWKDENDLPFYQSKTPIDSMNRLKLFANWPMRINERWFMLNSVNVNSTYEREMSDSFGAGIMSFFSYKIKIYFLMQFYCKIICALMPFSIAPVVKKRYYSFNAGAVRPGDIMDI